MKVAVVGSRGLAVDLSPYIPEDCTEIISGGAKGIDTKAKEYADRFRLSKHIIRPLYKVYGKAAPIVRNRILIDEADTVIAVWDGASPGTGQAIAYARKTGKKLVVIEL